MVRNMTKAVCKNIVSESKIVPYNAFKIEIIAQFVMNAQVSRLIKTHSHTMTFFFLTPLGNKPF